MITHFLRMCNKKDEAGNPQSCEESYIMFSGNLSLESAFQNFIVGRTDDTEDDLQRAAEAFEGDKVYQFEHTAVKEQV